MDASAPSLPPIAREIWDMKYRFKRPDGTPVDETVEDTWRRVARTLAAVEAPADRARWEETFFDVMAGYRFLPAGRILAGAGTGRSVTLFNCFVMGTLDDSMPGIFQGLKEAALTLQQGGGIGHDFSTLRPSGAPVAGVGADASGPLSFMDVWDAMCRTIMSAGSRRGAMMATLRCDHPDIEAFVDAKRDPKRLRNFNLSVLVTDAFMAALEADADWPLVFAGETYKVVKARALWDRIMRATYDSAEPGVVFIDRVNEANNLGYCETIHATNPCGEQAAAPLWRLPARVGESRQSGARAVRRRGGLDLAELDRTVAVAVRMMDNVIETSNYPLPEQAREAKAKRRIGLGLTGLADALAMCGLRYGSEAAAAQAKSWMAAVESAAYAASIALAKERGAFPLFEADAYLASGHVRGLPEPLRRDIATHGIRNALRDLDRADGHDLAVRRQRVERRRAGLRPALRAQGAAGGRLAPHRAGRGSRAVALSRALRCGRGAAGLFRHRPDARAGGPSAHAGGAAGPRRFLDLQDHQLPRLHRLRRLQGGVPAGLRPRPQGLHHLPAEPDHRRRPVVERRGGNPGPAGAAARGAGGRAGRRGRRRLHEAAAGAQTVLPGFTYKLKWPDSDHAIYITINDILQDGRRRPFEIFINSKNMEHYAWTVALTRMVSAVFRRGGDVAFVVEELKAVFDPRGGHWLEGRYVPSLLAAIGGIIERHMIDIGFIKPREASADSAERLQLALAAGDAAPLRQCPRCGEAAIVHQEGCARCLACDYSKCG
jgi:ribonucleoside-diphosphate reductase alpha chain